MSIKSERASILRGVENRGPSTPRAKEDTTRGLDDGITREACAARRRHVVSGTFSAGASSHILPSWPYRSSCYAHKKWRAASPLYRDRRPHPSGLL